ncbi:PIN domain-containing protein [Filimonas lacunae]|uniref:PIN domain-containing protein n=1 Tax=Filimonas lacunae TaxID=477680 RepID=A0A173MGJ7_9BACT|nr:PIN domain-containing protein [Filimonas lacunae]BAV06723.1 hypothetical protein FLA_2743 [Filimonas lacunae]SIT34461.1 PIN domain-containing protein [Filimonas lacunae]
MTYLFLDTNVFLHFIDFEHIPWDQVVPGNKQYTIVVAPMVMNELDGHKYNDKNKKVAQKAKKACSKLDAIGDENKTSRYPVKILLKTPQQATFDIHELDRREQDQVIIATMLEFQEELTNGDNIHFISNDSGPRQRARQKNLSAPKLSEDYLATPEPDETEKELTALKKEVAALKNRMPVMKLSFADGQLFCEHKLDDFHVSKENYVTKVLSDVMEKHSYALISEYKPNVYPFVSKLFHDIRNKQAEHYNENLDSFFEDYKSYLENDHDYLTFIQSIIPLEFMLINEGNSPADSMEVTFSFQGNFEIIEDKHFPKRRKKPTPPEFSANPYGIRIASVGTQVTSSMLGAYVPGPDFDKPDIRKTETGYDVSFTLPHLRHKQQKGLRTIYVRFESMDKMEGFSINYKLHVDNIPNVISGTLNVNVVSN